MAIDPASLAVQAATYKVIGSGSGLKLISSIMLMIAGPTPDDHYWLSLSIEKTDGKRLVASALVDDPHLCPARVASTRVLRYIYQEGDHRPIEYVNAIRGGAVTTPFGLLSRFFPVFSEPDLEGELLPTRGRFLGCAIERTSRKTVDAAEEWPIPNGCVTLELDPELLIATSRNVRDTLGDRLWTGEDYAYRRLEKEDYDELIDAGMNYFGVDQEQESILWNRPVFYVVHAPPRKLLFPEMFYRANCLGTTMFMDEPGVHMVWFVREWPGMVHTLDHPAQVARLLEDRVRTGLDSAYGYGSRRLEHMLRLAPFDVGDLRVPELHYPAWETMEWSAYYQMKAGLPGVVHEGRYVFGHDPQVTNAEFDARIPCRPESIFLQTYGFLRGAARVFDGDWGTSIYGQSQRDLNPLAMKTAYDMGARYVWFWTSDRLHHVPYEEQVALTRGLRSHARAHPRPPLGELRRAARVAIALPDGYCLRPHRLWDAERFHLDWHNAHGVTLREVLANAARQIERCIREDIPFDLVYADDALAARIDKYEEVVFIREDGTMSGRRRGGSVFSVPGPTRTPEEQSARGPELRITAAAHPENPLAVQLTGYLPEGADRVGLKRRKQGEAGWEYWQVLWNVIVSEREGLFAHSQSGDTIDITLPRPGRYWIEGWTCDEQGVATRHRVEVALE